MLVHVVHLSIAAAAPGVTSIGDTHRYKLVDPEYHNHRGRIEQSETVEVESDTALHARRPGSSLRW